MAASLKKNILVSYASQIYVALLGILILPLYLQYMGAEAYGLVGVFAMLQSWFNLLDMGLTPTLARETARFKGGTIDQLTFLRLLRGLQITFFVIAILGGGSIFAFSRVLAVHWLNVQNLPIAQVQLALQLMAFSVALRWMSGLYRGCITGAECLAWLGIFNTVAASLRFLGVLPFLIWIDHSPTTFFAYQAFVSTFELTGLFLKTNDLKPKTPRDIAIGWNPKAFVKIIHNNLHFSLSIAFTSTAWAIISHTDKLLLSKYLSLADYGYFTMATLGASAVLLITGPISSALVPRMTRLQAENKDSELIALYFRATQLGTAIATSACMTLVFFGYEVVFSWTGDANLSRHVAPILRIYAIGNLLVALATFPYDLQVVKGSLKKHVQGNFIFIFFWIPLVAWSTFNYHAMGAAYTWLFLNALYFATWVPITHDQFMKNLHRKWLMQNVVPIILAGTTIAFAIRLFVNAPSNRDENLILILTAGLSITFFCLLSSAPGRKFITETMRKV